MSKVGIFILFAVTLTGLAAAPSYRSDVIELHGEERRWHEYTWHDIDGDRYADLIVLLPEGQELRIYRQSPLGMPSEPNQIVMVPPGTAWIRFSDVDPNAGDEMLLSQSHGLTYLIQEQGRYLETAKVLLKVPQVFDTEMTPHLLDHKQTMTAGFPMFQSGQVVFFAPDAQGRYLPQQTKRLQQRAEIDSIDWPEWSVGGQRVHGVFVQHKYVLPSPEESDNDRLDNHPHVRVWLKKCIDRYHGVEFCDMNNDQQEDVVVWLVTGDMPPKVTIMIFMCDAQGRFPGKPSQILRCRGIPVRWKKKHRSLSVLYDFEQDGLYELVLMDLRNNFVSVGSAVESVLAKGLKWDMTIRPFIPQRGFTKEPKQKIRMKTGPSFRWLAHSLHWQGDFNGDGLLDLAVNRSSRQYDIYLGHAKDYFEAKPVLELQTEVDGDTRGDVCVADYNGDGRADLFVYDHAKGHMEVLLSEKGVQP